jgi:TPP-dependent pyruvate/acetoin dehydrogenase alpha subunit
MTTPKKAQVAAPASAGENDGFSLIPNEKLLALYAAMLKCRMLEERILNEPTDARRHEASAVGVTIDLVLGDAISPARGNMLECFVKGVPLKTIFTWFGGPSGSIPRAYGRLNVIRSTSSFAAQFELASAAALLNRRRSRKSKNIVALFCDCEQPMAAAWEQPLRFAATRRLPMLFVCQAGAKAEEIAPQARDYGLPGITVDGEDVVAIYRVVSEAIAHARRGNGPTLIECKPWSLSGSRQKRGSSQGDPILTMERYLAGKRLFSRKLKAEVVAQFGRELDESQQAAANGRFLRAASK